MVVALVLLGTVFGYIAGAAVWWLTGSIGFGVLVGIGCGILVTLVTAIVRAFGHGDRADTAAAQQDDFAVPVAANHTH